MGGPDGILTVDSDDPEHVRAAASLHQALLGESPIPGLGWMFMTRFYYTQLVKDELIRCYLYRLDGEYVGFLAVTDQPLSFMGEGVRRHYVRLALILALSLCQKPSRARIMFATSAASRRRATTEGTDRLGEILSIGVLEAFRGQRVDPGGKRISAALLDAGIRYLSDRGCRRIELNVDQDNVRAIRFYQSYGFVLERSPLALPHDWRGRLVL